jgi:hypothetical protein
MTAAEAAVLPYKNAAPEGTEPIPLPQYRGLLSVQPI